MAYLKDGHPTTIGFADYPSVLFKEKTVTPFGVDGGEKNDNTTMRNSVWQTFYPQKLKTGTDITATVNYDPAVLDDIVDMVNINQEVTVTHEDGSTWTVWAYLQKFMPGENKKGEQPMATITLVLTNLNDSDVETGPVYAAAP